MYGHAEAVLGKLLRAAPYDRKRLFAATKVWTWGRDAGVQQMQESIRLTDIDRFDLIQIHNLRDWQVHLETLREWKQQGKVRYIGITTSHGRDHEELALALETSPFDFVQLSYNLVDREAERHLLPLAQERDIAVLANRPFQRGTLFQSVRGKTLPDWAAEFDCTSWAQFFLKFVVSHPAVTCAIPASSKVNHLVDNMTAGTGRLPDAAMRNAWSPSSSRPEPSRSDGTTSGGNGAGSQRPGRHPRTCHPPQRALPRRQWQEIQKMLWCRQTHAALRRQGADLFLWMVREGEEREG